MEVLEHGHYVPGTQRSESTSRYKHKKIWSEILVVSEDGCSTYVQRVCNDFDKQVDIKATNKLKDWCCISCIAILNKWATYSVQTEKLEMG